MYQKLIRIVIFTVVGGFANFAFASIVGLLKIPIYLDSVFTIIITLQFGLLPGIFTAIITNTLLAVSNQVLFPLVMCSILTATISYIFRKKRILKGIKSYLWMGLFISFSNGIIGSIIAYYLFDGVVTVHAIDKLVMGLVITGQSIFTSVFWAGMISNIIDKCISAGIAFFVNESSIFHTKERTPNY